MTTLGQPTLLSGADFNICLNRNDIPCHLTLYVLTSFFRKHKNTFAFCIIYQYKDRAGNQNHSSWSTGFTGTVVSCIIKNNCIDLILPKHLVSTAPNADKFCVHDCCPGTEVINKKIGSSMVSLKCLLITRYITSHTHVEQMRGFHIHEACWKQADCARLKYQTSK